MDSQKGMQLYMKKIKKHKRKKNSVLGNAMHRISIYKKEYIFFCISADCSTNNVIQ